MIQFQPTTTGAADVARFILIAAARQEASIDHLLLQQLLFAAQGWSLAERGRPLFCDELEAWPVGPVAPAVYREYEPLGMETIPPGAEPELADDEKALIEEVLLAYLSGEHALSTASQGGAWRDARRNLPPARSSRRKLTLESIHDEFSRRREVADAAIDRRLGPLMHAGAHNAKLIFGRPPHPGA